MDLTEAPEHLLVLGGSYIGLEFDQMFRRFGSRVTVIEYNDQLASREDADVAETLQETLAAEGVESHLKAQAKDVKNTIDGIALTVEDRDGKETKALRGSHLLLAVGRVPNADALSLEAAGVETNERGYVQLNEKLETSAPGIWAIGDVKGGP